MNRGAVIVVMGIAISINIPVEVAMGILFKNMPDLDGLPVQGNIDRNIRVTSLLMCATVCASRRNTCDAIYYDDVTSGCTLVYNQFENTTRRQNLTGTLFMIRGFKKCALPGYTYIWELDACVKFHSQETLTWEDSRLNCQNETGDLITIDSELKETLFLPYLRETFDNVKAYRWWIGLSDRESEGNFKWVTGQEVTYDNWNPGEPNDKTNSDSNIEADCSLYYAKNEGKSFAWYDRACDSALAFVCESKLFE